MKNLDNNLHRRAAQLGERLRCIIVSSVTNAPTIHRPKGESWREFLEYFPQFAREPSPFISRRPSIGVPTVLKYVEYRGDDNNKRGEREREHVERGHRVESGEDRWCLAAAAAAAATGSLRCSATTADRYTSRRLRLRQWLLSHAYICIAPCIARYTEFPRPQIRACTYIYIYI